MSKVGAVAAREYKVTVLTKGFIIGTFVLPLVIWGVMIVLSATGLLNTDKPPMQGTVAVVDTTEGAKVLEAFRAEFDPAVQKRRAQEERDAMIRVIESNPAAQMLTSGSPVDVAAMIPASTDTVDVTIEQITPDQVEAAKARVKSGELLAVVEITPNTLQVNTDASDATNEAEADGKPDDAADSSEPAPSADGAAPNTYRLVHDPKLDPDYVDRIRNNASRAIQDTRYRAAGMNPDLVRLISRNQPFAITTILKESGGEEKSNEIISEVLPFIFLILVFIATVTSGQYLLMSTLEEKSSRVMEVLLSAASPMQLMIGKLLGQALVGLTILAIYTGLGLAAAERFGFLSQLPLQHIPWLVLYFIIAYGLMASLNIAVGAAVNELRDTQALYPPITMLMMVPFVLMIPVTQNPGGWVAKLFSWIPFTTPYVMVMRLSQPSHTVALWELIGTVIVGFLGVAFLVWAASKIFRIGVLMYGKPPSLMGLIKWVRTG
ncbi:MAG: ABC transporter permease [Phycisphaerales bacterium]|nr:ABC transporter permease [Phycisphaerales bacterium]